MVAPYPDTDTRGVKELRQALERESAALVPELARSSPGEFGQGFYQLAGRMAAQLTARLNQTAKRDAIAFFDALDIPAPSPRAAEAPLVFTLAEKRDEPVPVPQGVQVGADAAGGEEVIFETRAALTLTPAHLMQLLAVDVGADRIERAPVNVMLTAPLPGPFPRYELATFADTGSKTIQVTPSTGLVKDDFIRVGKNGSVYRIEKIEQELCTLAPALEAAAIEHTVIEKITRFDAFALLDVQAHQVFIAHDDLLNLKEPAYITISIEPANVVGRLSEMDIALFIWDTRKNDAGEKETDWHELTLTGPVVGELKFYKSWQGEVEKFEVAGQKGRWLKLVLRDEISNRAGIGTRVNTLGLAIQSDPDAKAASNQTVTHAFSNNTPLPLTSNFFPFGPEPQRFDTFSLSAPEALSKKGAEVILTVNMVDASLVALSMAGTETGALRAYGVGRNGRLQAIQFGEAVRKGWQEIEHPNANPGQDSHTSVHDADALLLAPIPPQAIQIATTPDGSPRDIVVVWDRGLRVWTRTAGPKEDSSARTWQVLPVIDPKPEKRLKDAIVVKSDAISAAQFPAFLLGINEDGLYSLGIPSTGAPGTSWIPLTLTAQSAVPMLNGDLVLVPVLNADWPKIVTPASIELILVDSNGSILHGVLTNHTVSWTRIQTQRRPGKPIEDADATLKVRPVAALRGDNKIIIAAADNDKQLYALTSSQSSAAGSRTPLVTRRPPKGLELTVVEQTAIACLPGFTDAKARWPAIAAFGTSALSDKPVMGVWTRRQRFQHIPLPEANAPKDHPTVLWVARPADSAGPPFLAVGGSGEEMLWGNFENTTQVRFELYSRTQLTSSTATPDYAVIDPQGMRQVLDEQFVSTAERLSCFVVPKLVPFSIGTKYRFLNIRPGNNTTNLAGTFTASARDQLHLDSNDFVTMSNDVLVIEHNGQTEAYQVLSIDQNRIATLDAPLTGPAGTVTYAITTILQNGGQDDTAAVAEDIATLAKLSQAVPFRVAKLRLATGNVEQKVLAKSDDNIWLLIEPFSTAPTVLSGLIVREITFGIWSIEPLNRGYQNPDLSWEYFDGRGWERLAPLSDGTHNLATSGTIEFKVPSDLDQTDVAGQTDYWLRARLIGGDYGHAKYVVTTTAGSPSTQTITVDTSDLHPPEILSITASFKLTDSVAAKIVLVENNGGVLNQTQAAAEPNAEFELFEGLLALDRFRAETPLAGRALFLGFSKPFNVSSLSLYADAEEQDGEGTLQAAVLAQGGWRDGVTDDETVGFRRRGFVRISGLDAPVRAALFGQELYWLRLSLKLPDEAAVWKPRIKGLYVNAVLVDQARTVTREMLGSSDGGPNQRFTLSGKPVLLRDAPGGPGGGQAEAADVEIRIRERLSDEDRAALAAAIKGAEAVVNPPDLPGDWVLWRRIDSFLGAGGGDRVFTLDAEQGIVRFGDNRSGKIPPAGRDAICAFRYRQGGGVQGNVAAYAIKNLKTALESVDIAVNPIEAAGGLDTPDIDRIIASAPARLRHANRAVTPADMEAFAVASSPDVARARLVMPREPGDAMQLAIAIRTSDAQPRPSSARAEALVRYILDHASGGLDASALKVVPPDYVPLQVRVDLLATSADAVAGVDSAVRARLAKFLHPTNGGPDGEGWPFARRAWPSDIDRILAGIAGIDRVTRIELCAERNLDDLPPTAMICAADVKVEVTTGEPA